MILAGAQMNFSPPLSIFLSGRMREEWQKTSGWRGEERDEEREEKFLWGRSIIVKNNRKNGLIGMDLGEQKQRKESKTPKIFNLLSVTFEAQDRIKTWIGISRRSSSRGGIKHLLSDIYIIQPAIFKACSESHVYLCSLTNFVLAHFLFFFFRFWFF